MFAKLDIAVIETDRYILYLLVFVVPFVQCVVMKHEAEQFSATTKKVNLSWTLSWRLCTPQDHFSTINCSCVKNATCVSLVKVTTHANFFTHH